MLYELRHYDTQSARGLDALTQRFSRHTLRIWDRFGIEPVGFWSVIAGMPSPRLTYLLAWRDLAQRQTVWDKFTSDPEWKEVRATSEKEFGGSPVRTVTNSILQATPYSRLPRKDNQPSRLTGGVFELRTYCFEEGAKLQEASAWFGSQGIAHQEKHGLYAMGYWTTYIGIAPRLTYMLVFENLAHRERAWASFYTDPDWPTLQDGLYPDGKPLVAQIDTALMRGTQFSGWK